MINIDLRPIIYISIFLLVLIVTGIGLLMAGWLKQNNALKIGGGVVLGGVGLFVLYVWYTVEYEPRQKNAAQHQRFEERQRNGVILDGELYFSKNLYIDSVGVVQAIESGELPADASLIQVYTDFGYDGKHDEIIHNHWNTVYLT